MVLFGYMLEELQNFPLKNKKSVISVWLTRHLPSKLQMMNGLRVVIRKQIGDSNHWVAWVIKVGTVYPVYCMLMTMNYLKESNACLL